MGDERVARRLRVSTSGFVFRINYRVLVYVAVCAVALAGALTGAFLPDGDVTWVILRGAGAYVAAYIVARLLVCSPMPG